MIFIVLKIRVIIINESILVMVGGKPTVQTLKNVFEFDTIGTVCLVGEPQLVFHGGFEHTNLLGSSSES